MATISEINDAYYSFGIHVDFLPGDAIPKWNYLMPTRTALYNTFDCDTGSVIDQEIFETITPFNNVQKQAVCRTKKPKLAAWDDSFRMEMLGIKSIYCNKFCRPGGMRGKYPEIPQKSVPWVEKPCQITKKTLLCTAARIYGAEFQQLTRRF